MFSRNSNARSIAAQSGAESQQLMQQPQNTKRPVRGSRHHNTTPQVMAAPGILQGVLDGHEQYGSVVDANSISRAPGTNPANIQAQRRNPFPNISGVAAQFPNACDFDITGNPQFINIGVNNVFGETDGLENLQNFVSFAALHDSAQQDPDRCCHPGTREHVLKRLRHWIDNPNATDRIFWLHGPAGAGKSAIAQTIAQGYTQGEVGATFFFYRFDATRNDGNLLFTTIAWQLAFSIPAVKHFIVHALNKIPHIPTKGVESQFEQLVAHPTNNVASQTPQPAPVVIIDGVDECSDEQLQRRFLAVIGNAVKDCHVPLRFLISSRPEALIEETLNLFHDLTLRIDLATLDDSNRDIEKYLVDKFSDIASKHRRLSPTWPGKEIIQEVVFKSSGNFIFAFTVMRYISDEDSNPEIQLDIIRNLKPRGKVSPFASLDALYLEILERQRDQEFLKTFLTLFVGCSSIDQDELHKDYPMLMNISEEDLHIKLRRMRSLFKSEPFIQVYHKCFLDFLQDSSRSGQYHVNKQGGQKRYLELIINSVARHVSTAIDQPIRHEICRSSPEFKDIVDAYPPKIDLPVEDWQEALKPLLHLQEKLLKTSQPQLCRVTRVMRDLLLQLVVLQRNSHRITGAQAPWSTKNETATAWSPAPVTEVRQSILENDLDNCLFALLACLQKSGSMLVIDAVIIDHMSSLLAFGYTRIAARVRSVSNAQKLVDFIDLITNESILSQCGLDAARTAAYLVSDFFSRVPLLPRFLLNGPTYLSEGPFALELLFQSVLISRILDHNYIVPVVSVYYKDRKYRFDCCNVNGQNESFHGWLERSRPNVVTKIRVMLEVARTIQYIHSMGVALNSNVFGTEYIVLDSDLRARFRFIGLFAWWHKAALVYDHETTYDHYTYESNISTFANIFRLVCFHGRNENLPNNQAEDARQLIERCRAEDPKSRPTIVDVVKEMETWNLT